MELDLIINNARIITMDEARPGATSLGVWNGYVFGLDEQLAACKARKQIDAKNAVVVPGFYDAHNHMAAFGQRLQEIDASKFYSLDELYEEVHNRAVLSDEEWITGSGYDQTQLGGHPRRLDLDRVGLGKKVLLVHRTSHMLVASTSVFEEVGAMSEDYPVPAGGIIEREIDGAPTGLVAEQAMADFRNLRKPVPLTDLIRSLELASLEFASEGLTSVAEAGVGDSSIVGSSPIELAAYQSGHESGKIHVRTQLMVAMENFHDLLTGAGDGFSKGLDLGIRTGFGNDRLSVGPLKMFTDGALMSRTAAMSENFCGHDHAGIMQFGYDELTEIATHAHNGGWQIAMHAIGDEAVDVALDVFRSATQSNPHHDRRHRIEHASVVRPDQLERFVEQQIIPSPQGQFVYELGEGVRTILGEDRLPWTYRAKSFLDRGLPLPGSSDRPVVSDGSPLSAIQAMVMRTTAERQEFSPWECVSAFEALKSFTLSSAFASHQDHVKGMIAPGYYADFVVLEEDPTVVASEQISQIPIMATYLGGSSTFTNSGSWG